MKTKTNLLKLFIILLGASLLLWNCEDEYNSDIENQINSTKETPRFKLITSRDYQKNEHLTSSLEKINDKKEDSQNKDVVYSSLYNFYINTDYAVESSVEHVKTYTFQVQRDNPKEGVLENLLIHYDTVSYTTKQFLLEYPIINNNEYDFENIQIQEIYDETLNSKNYNNCYDSLVYQEVIVAQVSCDNSAGASGSGTHLVGGGCQANDQDQPFNIVVGSWVVVTACTMPDELIVGDSSSSGTSSGQTGSSSSSNSSYSGNSGVQTIPLSIPGVLWNNFYEDELNHGQREFLDENPDVEAQVQSFLNSNITNTGYSLEAQNFANEAIDIFIELDDFKDLIDDPNFDPLNDFWLKQLRDLAQRTNILTAPSIVTTTILNLLNSALDHEAVKVLTKTALAYNPSADTDTESTKLFNIENNPTKAVGNLLYDFANGKGPNKRDFSCCGDFWYDYFEGNRIDNIKADFEAQLLLKNWTFDDFNNQTEKLDGGIGFSPDHIGVVSSIQEHLNANLVQFFVGGASVEYWPSSTPNHIDVIVINGTTRNSLFLHQLGNYDRNISGNNVPLSTIKQYFYITIEVR